MSGNQRNEILKEIKVILTETGAACLKIFNFFLFNNIIVLTLKSAGFFKILNSFQVTAFTILYFQPTSTSPFTAVRHSLFALSLISVELSLVPAALSWSLRRLAAGGSVMPIVAWLTKQCKTSWNTCNTLWNTCKTSWTTSKTSWTTSKTSWTTAHNGKLESGWQDHPERTVWIFLHRIKSTLWHIAWKMAHQSLCGKYLNLSTVPSISTAFQMNGISCAPCE